MSGMDILFPWRKQPPPPPEMQFRGPSGGGHHSLPHPAEVDGRYGLGGNGGGFDGGGGFDDVGYGGGGGGQGLPPREMMRSHNGNGSRYGSERNFDQRAYDEPPPPPPQQQQPPQGGGGGGGDRRNNFAQMDGYKTESQRLFESESTGAPPAPSARGRRGLYRGESEASELTASQGQGRGLYRGESEASGLAASQGQGRGLYRGESEASGLAASQGRGLYRGESEASGLSASQGPGLYGSGTSGTLPASQSQRLFESETSGAGSVPGGRGRGGGGGLGGPGGQGGSPGRGRGGASGGGPRFRPPLDESNRSSEPPSERTSRGSMPVGQSRQMARSQGSEGYEYSDPELGPADESGYYDANGDARASKQDRSSRMQSFSTYGQSQSSRSLSHSYFGQSTSYATDQYADEEDDLPVSPLRQLLDAINMSILPASLRLSSLAQAVEFFDHRDRAMHDAELREGGAFVLYHKLGLVLRLSRCGESVIEESNAGAMDTTKKGLLGGANAGPNHYLSYQQSLANSLASQQQTEFDKEIAMICSCLEMVHRANPDAIAQTWDECGTEILPLLVHVLERPFQKIERAVWMALQEKTNVPGSLERAVAMAVTRDQKLAVQKVTKVLAMYSLVPEAKKPMCDCENMLRWLTRIIDTHNYNRVKPGAPVVGGSSNASGGVDLSGMDSGDGDEDAKAKQAKRLELAARATSGSGLYMTEAARFNTIATLTNLAALEANRMPMLREVGLLDNICRAVHNERSDVPKQCSALAIMNLSNGDMDHVPEMARNDLVLETLLKLMKEDNPETRRNAVVTIFNVACSDQNTVRLARYRDGTILEALVELVGSDDPVLRTHDEARANAAETIFNMSCSEISETTDRMANHAGLLECLAVTLRGEHTGLEVKMYCSATLRRMAELIRHPMIAQGALLSALVKASTWTNTDCIAESFRAQASNDVENCVIMAHHHGLLNALSRLALTRGEGPDVEKVRMAACLAIELMSRHDEARALLSQNEGIIMALTKASFGGDELEEDLRVSNVSGLEGSVTGFLDSSLTSGQDEESMQSRRIQMALKNLVSAM